MTKLQKARDKAAQSQYDKRVALSNVFDRETIAVESYKLGFDKGHKFGWNEIQMLRTLINFIILEDQRTGMPMKGVQHAKLAVELRKAAFAFDTKFGSGGEK